MPLDAVITGVKLLTSLLLVCATYLVFLPYFAKPEEFFIRRLRPRDDRRFTHAQLLIRAFGGAGLVSAGMYSLAFCLVFSLVLDVVWMWAWPAMTLGGGVMLGVGHYARFRLSRYRKLTPSEQRAMTDGDPGVFVRRQVSVQ